jgi:hypothetical protein
MKGYRIFEQGGIRVFFSFCKTTKQKTNGDKQE